MQRDEWRRGLAEKARELGEWVRAVDDDSARASDLSREFEIARVEPDHSINGWWLYPRRVSPGSEVAVSRDRYGNGAPQGVEPRVGDRVRYWGNERMPHGVALNDTVLWYDSVPWRRQALSDALAHALTFALKAD